MAESIYPFVLTTISKSRTSVCFYYRGVGFSPTLREGPSLVIALGRFFRVPLSDDESGVFFGLFSVCNCKCVKFSFIFYV